MSKATFSLETNWTYFSQSCSPNGAATSSDFLHTGASFNMKMGRDRKAICTKLSHLIAHA